MLMSKKFVIVGATGSVGSSLAKMLKEDPVNIHLIAKNKDEVSQLSDETGTSYSVADVLDTNFIEKVESDLKDTDILGIAYCVGSIDLKPIKFNI